ncbi:MAG: hypothetical protein II918_03395 [Firmicutes bacterium]|nr:hypothetical protein [Bacillota bacterium]
MLIAKIPGKLNNKRIVGIIDRLRRIEKAIKRDFSGNDLQNKKAYEHLLTSPDHGAFVLAGMKEHKPLSAPALIERQSELKDMSLGKSTLDYSGCEVIAVYNMLLKYDEGSFSVSLPTLIETFEANGILHAGRFGVSPVSIADYLRSIGITVNYTTDETDFDVLGFYCNHFILTVLNDRDDIFKQIHTFYISKDGDRLMAHNAGLSMRYFSISEIIKALPGGRAKGICMIGVKDEHEENLVI